MTPSEVMRMRDRLAIYLKEEHYQFSDLEEAAEFADDLILRGWVTEVPSENAD